MPIAVFALLLAIDFNAPVLSIEKQDAEPNTAAVQSDKIWLDMPPSMASQPEEPGTTKYTVGKRTVGSPFTGRIQPGHRATSYTFAAPVSLVAPSRAPCKEITGLLSPG